MSLGKIFLKFTYMDVEIYYLSKKFVVNSYHDVFPRIAVPYMHISIWDKAYSLETWLPAI